MRKCVNCNLVKGTWTITKHPIFPFVKPQSCLKTFQLLRLLNPNSIPCDLQIPQTFQSLKTESNMSFKKDAECISDPLWSGSKFRAAEENVGEISSVHLQEVTHRNGCVFGNEMASETRWVPSESGVTPG